MKTWFITGVSTGFGRALAEAVLEKGDRVIGTLRSEQQRATFAALGHRAVGVLLDVTDHVSVTRVVGQVERDLGPIDVLVNNAGYAYEITIEEAEMNEVRRQFEVNFFGTLAVTQAVLPFMRKRQSGHILIVTSIAGIVGCPGLGIYSASKFALEGMCAILRKEVLGFGIRVTAIEPGMFRTDWAARSMMRGTQSVPDYRFAFGSLRQARLARCGKQMGDPRKAARAIIAAVDGPEAPRNLLLGSDALSFARTRLADLASEYARWEALTVSTDFD